MKHLKVLFALSLTVVGLSLIVFAVHEFTEPQIQAMKDAKADEAKYRVLPTLVEGTDQASLNAWFSGSCADELAEGKTCDSETYDFMDYDIVKVNVIEGKGYIYEVTYGGYAGPVTYLLALDLDGNITGFEVVSESETTDVGGKIKVDAVKQAFLGLTVEASMELPFDTISGASATITFAGLKASLQDVKEFHAVNFQGVVLETPEERLARLREEATVAGAVFADVTADYDLTGTKITKVETVNADEAMLYTLEFLTDFSYANNVFIVGIDLNTNEIIGLRVLEAGDTLGYGSTFGDEAYDDQFEGMTFQDALDGNIDAMAGTSGAPVTTGALKAAMASLIEFHNNEVLNVAPVLEEAPLDKLQAAYPAAASFTSVYVDMTQDDGIYNIYEAKDAGDVVIGYVYFAKASGAFGSTLKYVWSVDLTGLTVNLKIVSGAESWDYAPDYNGSAGFDFTTSTWLDQFEGIQIDSILTP